MGSPVSFRARILLIVLVLGVIPLGLLGLWLTRSTARSAEELVRAQLQESVEGALTQVVSRWTRFRSPLLDLVEDPEVQAALVDGAPGVVPPSFRRIFAGLDPSLFAAVARGDAGEERWRVEREAGVGTGMQGLFGYLGTVSVPLEVRDRLTGGLLGEVEATFSISALLPPGGFTPSLTGAVVGVFDSGTGASLLPISVEATLLVAGEFQWAGTRWLAEERTLGEPPLRLVAAGPLTPFIEPFQDTARRSAGLVLLVALAGLAMASLLTSRLTRSLEDLSAAADAVSGGDLDRRLEVRSGDEVGRVTEAFNTMTESLERTLRELSTRESLAAVGEFAASLAHEIRNPLTAIKVDLQLAEEELEEGSVGREAQRRALHEVLRLNETVAKALKVARSGPQERTVLDLRGPVEAAARAAGPAFAEKGANLEVESGGIPLPMSGDEGALEDLFLNLFRNAAQALEAGGRAGVRVAVDEGRVEILIQDDGIGIPAELQGKVFEPLFSTRPEGTGLGLTISRRIALAHGGELELVSSGKQGTIFRLSLPLTPAER
jgi:signal transduction histidine kinase